MSGALGRQGAPANLTSRPVLATFDDYAGAQKAVDTLSDNGFPVQNVTILGVDVRIVESVLGRLTWGRAALGGMFQGAWFGLLIGLFVGLFSSTSGSLLPLAGLGLLYGAAFGIVFGVVQHALTGGKRDFVSRQQLVAKRYDVLCEQSVIADARRILGLGGGWPPSDPTATAPTTSPLDDAAQKVAEAVDDATHGVPPALP
jgi:hypothetical protein